MCCRSGARLGRARRPRPHHACSPSGTGETGTRTWRSSPAARPTATRHQSVSNSEKSNCHTWFGPVGSWANAALCRPARSRVPSDTPRAGLRLVAQQPQHGGLGHDVTVVTGHRPHLAMTPRGMGQGMLDRQRALPPGQAAATALSPCSQRARRQRRQRALGHVNNRLNVRLHADHLEVLEGPNLPSADFFHTRISTAASPRAWVKSCTSASSCSSREDGSRLAPRGLLRPQEVGLHRPIDCSTPSPAGGSLSNTISPANTLNTIRVFFLNRNRWGLP